jgi:dienelactone hydrolase
MPTCPILSTTRVPHVNAAHDTIFMRLYLPDSPSEPPYPVVILLPDLMCSAASYDWLATALAQRGFAAVTYDWIIHDDSGYGRLTPGVESTALDPSDYHTLPSAPAIPAILTELERLNGLDRLDGQIDLHRLIFGGHGVGGWLALHNATRRFFLGLTAAFAFAPNPGDLLERAGHESGALPVMPSDVPTLILAATEDRIETPLPPDERITPTESGTVRAPGAALARRLWDRVGGGHGHAYYMSVRGANHYTVAYPLDTAAGAAAADAPESAPGADLRALIADIVATFAAGYGRRAGGDIERLRRYIGQRPPLVGETRLK